MTKPMNYDDIMYGPFTVDLNVYLSNGEQVAVAKCNMPVGVLPSAESVQAMLAEAEKSAQTQAASFKLMDRNEFENTILAERTGGITAGQHFATKAEWDKPPADDPVLHWAVGRWQAEVFNRPLQNVHRRSLDDTWRQVIRHFGGDDVALCGPAHDVLLGGTTGRGYDEEDAPGNEEGA